MISTIGATDLGSGDVVIVKNDGRVGIGTTSPGAKLHIENPTGPVNMRIEALAGNVSSLDFYESTAGPQGSISWHPGYNNLMLTTSGDPVKHIYLGPRNNVGIKDVSPDGTLEITNYPSAPPYGDLLLVSSEENADGDYLIVKGDGKVGIGTTSPQKLLHVAGDMQVDGLIDPTGLVLDEQTSAPTGDAIGKGQIFVKNTNPQDLIFRDETGIETSLLAAGTDHD